MGEIDLITAIRNLDKRGKHIASLERELALQLDMYELDRDVPRKATALAEMEERDREHKWRKVDPT